MSERASVSSKTLFVGLAASLVVALGIGLIVYVKYVRYSRIAERHASPDSALIVSLEVEQAVAYEPFRRHLLSLVEAGKTGKETRVLHVERKTTLELGVDTREVVFAFGAGGELTAVVGGLFRREGVVFGIHRLLEDEQIVSTLGDSPERVVLADGQAFAQATDGALVVGTSEASVSAGLREYGNPPAEKENRPVLRLRSGKGFQGLELPSGAFLTGAELEIVPGRAAKQPPFLLRGTLQTRDAAPNAQDFKEIPGISGVHISRLVPAGKGAVTVEGDLTREAFDQLIAEVGSQVAARLHLP